MKQLETCKIAAVAGGTQRGSSVAFASSPVDPDLMPTCPVAMPPPSM